MRLHHCITIQRPLEEVYDIASQIERYPEYMPDYLESRILERREDYCLVERKAKSRGLLYSWKSKVCFDPPYLINFEHLSGPVKGMIVQWRFHAVGHDATFLEFIHQLQIKTPPLLGWFRERFFFAPRISETADRVIISFKQACENSVQDLIKQ